MNLARKKHSYFNLALVFTLLLVIPCSLFSQVIKGIVIYEKDDSPVPYATVEIQNQKEASFSDKSGNFSLRVSTLRNNDTLLISSIGYQTLRIPAASALKKTRFALKEKSSQLQNVTVKSFSARDELGSNTESVGFYRSWSHQNNTGEIGRIFQVPYKEFKIDKIRFKASNLCDTCLLRLRMRNVVNGLPAEEILRDSVTMTINKLTLDGKVPEFDISAYDFTFTQKEIYVGIEVLNCRSKNKENCSFCFAGTEHGEYVYRSAKDTKWELAGDYTVHLKLFLRY